MIGAVENIAVLFCKFQLVLIFTTFFYFICHVLSSKQYLFAIRVFCARWSTGLCTNYMAVYYSFIP
jgi:hypothetical protein